MKYSLLLLFISTFSATSGAIDFNDYAISARSIGKSIISEIGKTNPSPDEFYEAFRNIIVGYPFLPFFSFMDALCSVVLSEDNVQPQTLPEIEKLNYVLKTEDKNISVPLNDTGKLWSLEEFNPKLPLIVMVTGWQTHSNTSENPALDRIYSAYRCRGGYNFVTVDTSDYVDTIYSWSAFNTEEVGKLIADSLEILIQSYPIENIHLIGHSLGAQICGSAGKNLYYKTNELLPKITGLDPANPCFNSGESLNGLERGDAESVMVIHTNPGIFGRADAMGDIDFYTNGQRPIPPGCLTISCAHGRAWEYFAESIFPGNEHNLMGVKCSSLSALKANFCRGTPVPMGYATPSKLKGIYQLETNGESPYGKNATKNFKLSCQNSKNK